MQGHTPQGYSWGKIQQNIPRQGESHKRPYTHMLERCYQAFGTVKSVGACICSPSSVIAAAHGRVNTAQPSALPFALRLSLLSPLVFSSLNFGASGAVSCCSRLCLFPPSLPTAYGCVYVPAVGKMFPDKYSFTPTTAPPTLKQPTVSVWMLINRYEISAGPLMVSQPLLSLLNYSAYVLWSSVPFLSSPPSFLFLLYHLISCPCLPFSSPLISISAISFLPFCCFFPFFIFLLLNFHLCLISHLFHFGILFPFSSFYCYFFLSCPPCP